jgi:hypothetical protein
MKDNIKHIYLNKELMEKTFNVYVHLADLTDLKDPKYI